jgi:hypothetical protein
MPTGSPTDIAGRIQALLAERQQLVDQLARIDAALERVQAALSGVGVNGAGRRGPGRPPKAAGVLTASGRRGKGKRGSYAQTADAMILALAGQKNGATTQEIKARWKAEGRGGTADNAISKLVKAKKLKRSPLEGQRGSRFTMA